MEQTEKSAAKTEAQSDRTFALENKRGIIQLQLPKVRFQVLIVGGVDRINPAEHHRMNFLKTGQHWRWIARLGNCVAHFDFLRAFDVRRHVAGFANFEFITEIRFWVEAAD